jgi:hypothetical protein
MLFDWSEVLSAAIASLSPLRQEIVMYILGQRGGRRPSYSHALATWSLDRKQFDIELLAVYSDIRQYLRRYGLGSSSDLEFV